MFRWNTSTLCNDTRPLMRALAAVTAACLVNGAGVAATLPTAPKTFDTTYVAPKGATLTVGAGGNLQAALDKAQLGDTIVLQAGATFTGPFQLPNKTAGSGWIYVVSSNLSQLPPPGTRVSPENAANMPKILAPNVLNALTTVANSHHFRFVGLEFAPVSGSTKIYAVVTIGNDDTSPATPSGSPRRRSQAVLSSRWPAPPWPATAYSAVEAFSILTGPGTSSTHAFKILINSFFGFLGTNGLHFNDPAAASEVLAALRQEPQVVSACLYRASGELFAKYQRLASDHSELKAREREVLSVTTVLVLVGLLFSAAIYPLIGGLRDPAHSDTGDTMMMSLYFALGAFLLIAVRNPRRIATSSPSHPVLRSSP